METIQRATSTDLPTFLGIEGAYDITLHGANKRALAEKESAE